MFRTRERLVAFLLISSLAACGGDDSTQPAADPCAAPAAITLGQTVTSTLATGDCEVDGSLADVYALTLTAATTVVIDLSSTAFDAYLEIRNASGAVIATGDDTDDTDARIIQSLAAGSYRVYATSYFPGESGGYLLSIAEAPDCTPVGSISSGETVNGTISSDDCLLVLGGRWNTWTLTVPDAAELRLRVVSTDFDEALGVLNAGNPVLYFDTDSPSGTATGDVYFDAGVWTLAAGARGDMASGAYSLAVAPRPACEPGTDIGIGDVVSGTVDADDCYLFGSAPADSFTLVLTEETEVRLTQTSPDFPPYFIVGDTFGNIVVTGDNRGTDSASFATVFTPGRWPVLVSGTGNDAIGTFELTLTAGSCPAATPIALGQTLAGILEEGDCFRPGVALQDAFTLEVPADTAVRIELDAPNFDAYLLLKDSVGNVLEENDDGGGNTNSLIERRLLAGTYRIGASAFAGSEGGTYTLRVLLPAAPATAGGLPNDAPQGSPKPAPGQLGIRTSLRGAIDTDPAPPVKRKAPRRIGS
jgi:hypothetical protein